ATPYSDPTPRSLHDGRPSLNPGQLQRQYSRLPLLLFSVDQKNCNQMVISYVRYSLVNYFYSLWLTPTASICLALCFIPFTRYCKFSSLSTFSFHVHFSFDLYIWLILISSICATSALDTTLSFNGLKIS